MDLADIQHNFESLRSKIVAIEPVIGMIIEQNSGQALQLVKDQLLLGRDADGNPITPTYASNEYADWKFGNEADYQSLILNKNLFPARSAGTPNLFLTGSFQRGLFLDSNPKETLVDSTDSKARMLENKYGNILDFSQEAKDVFWENVLANELYNYLMDGLRLY